jgi:DMSO reductase anchor subunit
VVLPGAQALLGFQFVVILTESFDRLPNLSKYIHLAALGLNALTIVLLITPAAYHRLVEQGEETEHFHRFASKILVAALVPLALGLAGDVYVVVQKVTESQLVSVVSALVVLAVFWELWFGLTLYRRTQRQYAD